MLFVASLLVLSFGASCKQSSSVEPKGELNAGELAPIFSLVDTSGATVSLDDFKGKTVLLNFWATWCAPCVAEMPALERLYQIYRERGFTVIAVSGDAKENASQVGEFIRKHGLTFPVLLDPEFVSVKKYGVTGFPESFFLDETGKFMMIIDPDTKRQLVRIISDRPWDAPAYLKVIEQLLPERNS